MPWVWFLGSLWASCHFMVLFLGSCMSCLNTYCPQQSGHNPQNAKIRQIIAGVLVKLYRPNLTFSLCWSLVNMNTLLSSFCCNLFLGSPCAWPPVGPCPGFPKGHFALAEKPPGWAPAPRASCVVHTLLGLHCRAGLPQASCCLNKSEWSPSFPLVPNR